ncbi:MAG: MFS transporter [Candidatus Hydrogenedentes bacterium]|nr:MFS transporter [Candidatus Hydrogenedentota bacterium]
MKVLSHPNAIRADAGRSPLDMTYFHPKESLSEDDIRLGMRMMLYDAAFVTVLAILTTGAFLVGFALALGASNAVVGVIAAAGPLAQILQLPSIVLIERYRKRKLLTLYAAAVSRMTWFFIALAPWVVPREYWIPSFLVLLFVHFATGNLTNCAWNSWVRDLVPTPVFGTFFAKRMALATFIGAVLSVAGAIAVDMGKQHYGSPIGAYTGIFVIAAVSAVVSLFFIARMPEPEMPVQSGATVREILRQPLRDATFRSVLIFLAWWNFAVNFAAPFFAVYMIRKLEMSMVWVIGLSVLSQMVNVLFFRVWGRLADRYSNKSVLTVSGPLFIVTFLVWPFTTMPDAYFLTIPLLIAIHVLAGISTAGVTLCTSNLAFKAAPYGKATAYLAVNALISGVMATIAPVAAGLVGDYCERFELQIMLRGIDTVTGAARFDVPTVDLQGLDYVFLLAAVFGAIAIHRLLAVREEGEVEEAVVRQELMLQMRRMARQVSTVAGMRQVINFPFGTLKQWRQRRRETE